VRTVEFVRVNPSTRDQTMRLGDRVITTQALFNESDDTVGTLSTDCVNVGGTAQVFKATLQCTSIYRLADGEVVGLASCASTPDRLRGSRSWAAAVPTATRTASRRSPVKGYDSTELMYLGG
jgi:hypothetical protein